MKTFLLSIALLFLGVTMAQADTFTLFSGKTQAGEGRVFDLTEGHEFNNWTCCVSVAGSPSTVTVRLNGNTGQNMFNTTGMGSYTLTAQDLADGMGCFSVANKPVKRIKGTLATVSGGTSPTVSMTCTGVMK